MNSAVHYALAIAAFACTGLAPVSDPDVQAPGAGLRPEAQRQTPLSRVTPPDSAAPQAEALTDREFVLTAARAGRQEVIDARDAMQRARRGDVRSAAKSMLDEHTEVNQRLEALATRKGWALPAPESPEAPTPVADADFDASFLASQARAHRQTIALFRAHAANVGDRELGGFVQATLPILDHHLETVLELRRPGGPPP